MTITRHERQFVQSRDSHTQKIRSRCRNRGRFTPQSGPTTDYTLANAANEYATVDPDGPGGNDAVPVTYDAVGNLTVDEDGRHYSYDEQNRLTQVRAADDTTVLADYAYDALGRRVRSSILAAQASPPVVTRYYYDGPSIIEERDAADARTRYHVNGAQRIDERVATYSDSLIRAATVRERLANAEEAAQNSDVGRRSANMGDPPAGSTPDAGGPRAGGSFTYYLQNDLYSITGVGEADGTIAAAYIYDGTGRASLSSGGGTECQPSDADCSGAVDIADVAPFVAVLLGGTPCSTCAGDTGGGTGPGSPPDGLRDGRDVQAFVDCLLTGDCPITGGVSCMRGDINGDGFVDGGNIGWFMDVLLGLDVDPVHVCAADIDGDGDVDWTDEELFRDCLFLGSCDLVCLPGDVSADGVVDLADIAPFVGVLLSETGTAQELCAADLCGPAGSPRDGLVDGNDLQALVNCLVHADCPPPLGGGGRGGRDGETVNNTFYLHGSIVDALDPDESGAPRLQLQYNRARYYDLRHARWLQRDPTGYSDGGNLYEAFGGNPARYLDPSGEEKDLLEKLADFWDSVFGKAGSKQPTELQIAAPLNPMEQYVLRQGREFAQTVGPKVDTAVKVGEQVLVRGAGVLGAVGGVGETTVGVILFVPSGGATIIFIVHGADGFQACVRQTASGEFTSTYTYQFIAESGHENVALCVDCGISLLSCGAGLLAPARAAPAGLRMATLASELGPEVRVTGRTVPLLNRTENAYQRVMVFLYDAKPGEVVLGSGLSPGPIPGSTTPTLSMRAGARGVAIHEAVAAEYVQAGGTYLGYRHPITDILGAGGEQISIRTVDLASKTYQATVPAWRTHPLTSTLTNKAWKLEDLTTAGPRVLHVEVYGPKPTEAQLEAILGAMEEASRFIKPVEVRWGHRP